MLIDCDACEVRGLACSDCVVSVLLGVPDEGAELNEPEQVAIDALADAGLVPPLRLAVARRRADDEHARSNRRGHLPQARSAR
jgi:hypothetical protein